MLYVWVLGQDGDDKEEGTDDFKGEITVYSREMVRPKKSLFFLNKKLKMLEWRIQFLAIFCFTRWIPRMYVSHRRRDTAGTEPSCLG